MFVDSDDAITKTALDELYKTAEKYKVDVVHCAEYFFTEDGSISTDKKILQKRHMPSLDLVSAPTFYLNNAEDRIKNFATGKFWTAPWNYFFRRDFLMQNKIEFPNMRIASDVPFAFFISFLAESIINAPICYYVYRIYAESNSQQVLQPEERIEKRGSSIFRGLECMNKFMEEFEIFQKIPEYKYAVFDFFLRVNSNLPSLLELYTKIPAANLDGLIRREFEKIEDKTELATYFFSRMNLLHLQLIQQQQFIEQMQK